jgi:phosphohistidine phosphatase
MRLPGGTRRLLLLRHAKSSWDDAALDDFDRPLAPRGRKAAARMGRHLGQREPVADLVLCSSAARAVETWARVAERFASPPPLRHLKSLYLAPPSRLLAALRRLDDGIRTALLVGHNPGLQALALGLAAEDGGARRVRLAAKFPTAALAVFEVSGPWAELAPGNARLADLTLAREID